MAALLGKIDEFDSAKEEWPQYVERVDHFFAANGIEDAGKKRSAFLAVMGPATYTLVRNLVSPDKPGDKTYTQLVEVLTSHFNPTPSETVERFKFKSRFRKPGESVATFVSELRSLAEFCNFGATLDNNLRDQIVCGVNNARIQRRLLAERDLTFNRAMELAQGLETAARNVKELAQGSSQESSEHTAQGVNRVTPPARGKDTGSSSSRGGAKFSGECFCCGKTGHRRADCRFKDAECHRCGKKGHLREVCKSKKAKAKPKSSQKKASRERVVNHVEEEGEVSSNDSDLYCIKSPSKSQPYQASFGINGKVVTMEIDTGASLSLVSERTFKENWPDQDLSPTEVTLHSYSGESIPVLGSVDVVVEYDSQRVTLPLIVVKGEGPSLVGRNWLNQLKLNWHEIFLLQSASLSQVLERYETVFNQGLGAVTGFKAKIIVDPEACPKFQKARSIPYYYREKVEKELKRLVEEGTLEPVEHSDWASPIVAVLKQDRKNVRICGDFKQTVNPVAKLDKYPIPRIEDLFSKLSGGQTFTKLDLSQAYLQVPLDEESKKFLVVNTHKGLFRYNRLPYGVSSAPGIFQRLMESVLQDIPHVVVYLDDILITGVSQEEHLRILALVLGRLEKIGLRVKRSKCDFMAKSVKYLGYRIDKDGLHPLKEKVRAIHDAPSPCSVSELKSYLGLLTYYSKFLPNMSTVLAPLYRLLRKEVTWKWSSAEKKAFQDSKNLLTSSSLLVHFNPELELLLMCDASSYGVGAVLAHRMPDGSERPIGYASRSLSKSQRNYSQIEREALALVFGVQRFRSYIFGHHFELVTDHQPLLALLNEHRATSTQASARIRRWSLLLSAYEYSIKFRKTQAHQNADALSRLPLPDLQKESPNPPELVLLTEHLEQSPVTAQHIRVWTRRDPVLSKVLQYIQQGWPARCSDAVKPYFHKRSELSVFQGCVMWGSRVVIPPRGRKAVLQELHEGHLGMTKTKSLARMYVWWPGLDKDIEESVKLCIHCQEQQPNPPAAPLQPWKWPSRPWVRLHMDFAGPFEGKMILVVIDSHSKWIEAFPTSSSTSHTVIEFSRTLFAQFGVPEVLVTDNGSCFVSEEFETFLLKNGIKHLTSAPYHPATNGLAERAVQTVKKGLKKERGGSMAARLAKVLITYRATPQSTTGESPAQLLQHRQIRTRLDLLKPSVDRRVEHRQQQQKLDHDNSAKENAFTPGEKVYVRNFGTGTRWLQGRIQEATGPVSYLVKLEDNRLVRRHQDHLRRRVASSAPEHTQTPGIGPEVQEEELEEIQPEVLNEAPLVPEEAPLPTPNGAQIPGDAHPSESTTDTPPEADVGVEVSGDSGEVVPPATPGATPRTTGPKTYPRRKRQQPDWYHSNLSVF